MFFALDDAHAWCALHMLRATYALLRRRQNCFYRSDHHHYHQLIISQKILQQHYQPYAGCEMK